MGKEKGIKTITLKKKEDVIGLAETLEDILGE